MSCSAKAIDEQAEPWSSFILCDAHRAQGAPEPSTPGVSDRAVRRRGATFAVLSAYWKLDPTPMRACPRPPPTTAAAWGQGLEPAAVVSRVFSDYSTLPSALSRRRRQRAWSRGGRPSSCRRSRIARRRHQSAPSVSVFRRGRSARRRAGDQERSRLDTMPACEDERATKKR